MNAKVILFVAAGLMLGLATAVVVLPGARQALMPSAGPSTSGKALVGGPFNLTSDNGEHVTDKDFRGRHMLVFFGFTHCPDICPASLQLISAAMENLGDKADRITPIFVSVDPERDTPEKLHEYIQNFDPRLVGLTGTPEEIDEVTKAYKVYFKKVPNEAAPDDYGMDHTGIIYLMDPRGQYVAHFTPTTTVEQMTQRLDKEL
jgi:cytochrome oxidase Cu insertion factor (SCO1/SenC/PrrC family)